MAINFNDNIKVSANKPLDFKFGPFESIAQANSLIPAPQRHHGLIFGVYTTPLDLANSDIDYYYYWDDLSDTSYKRLILEQNFLDAIEIANNASAQNPFVTLDQLNSFSGSVNRVVFGGVPQWSGVGLIFNAPLTGYVIDGTYYEDGPEQITLATANPTNPRRDRFILSSSGWGVLQGTPATIPIAEQINIITQIDRGDVLIGAGATTPTITNENIYIDNLDWTTSSSGTGTFNPNSTADPFAGGVSFEATNIEFGARMIFTRASNLDISTFTSLGLQIKLKANLDQGRSVRNIFLQFVDNSNNPVSTRVPLSIVKNNTTGYQFSSLAISDFTFSSPTTVRRLWITYSGSGTSLYSGFFVDNVILQAGVSQPDAPQNIILTDEVVASGPTGAPITATVTEKAVSNKPANISPSDLDELLLRKNSDGSLTKITRGNLLKRSVVGVYVDSVAMIADQANQQQNNIYQADDIFYKYKGTTSGVLETDYDAFGSGSGGSTIGAEPVEEKFTYTSPAAQTFTVVGTPNGRPALYVNGQYLDWTFWTWNNGTKIATVTGVTLPDTSKIVIKYYSNISGNPFATIGAEAAVDEFVYTSPNPQTFTAVGSPNGRPDLYVNGQFADWSLWTWDTLTKTATFTGDTIPNASEITLKYYINLTGNAVGSVTGPWVDNTNPVNPIIGYQEAEERASNTVLFDKNYVIGNAAARTGNILFDFTGAKLGAWTEMKHQSASAFTFPSTALLMFDSADISTTVANYFLFVLTKKSSTEVVKVFHALEGGVV